jgi:hypothetical protein
MKGKSAVLGCVVSVWTAVAMAQTPVETSVVYKKDGGELAILEGQNETLVYYGAGFPQGQSVGTCECSLVVQKKDSPTQWTLKGTDSNDTMTLRLDPRKVEVSSVGGGPECCGAGWGGDVFQREKLGSLAECKVKAARAYFHDSNETHAQRKAFVVAGDTVQAFVPAIEPEFVPARFVSPKRTTVGLLRREQLDCQTTAKAREDLKPLAGTWVQVERKGKGYVIKTYCGSNPLAVEIRTNGVMNIDYGQDDQDVEVTAAKPGAAGAYTLEVKWPAAQSESLAWSVVDAKRSIIQLRGGKDYFAKGVLYVRADKKGAIPVQAEKCDEYD